jgi:hypothetical protein
MAPGVPLSTVRVHDDLAARVMTGLLGNEGFAVGEHVVLGDATPSPARDKLLAHELVHVLQQRPAGARERSPDPEREADELAARSDQARILSPLAAPQRLAAKVIARTKHDLGNGMLLIVDIDDGDFVGGCVKAIVPHVGVKLVLKGVPKGEGNQLFNIHMGIMTNKAGESCFFFYESVSGLCETKCFPTLEELKKALEEIHDWLKEKIEQVLRVLLPSLVAVALAWVIAKILIAAIAAAGILAAA